MSEQVYLPTCSEGVQGTINTLVLRAMLPERSDVVDWRMRCFDDEVANQVTAFGFGASQASRTLIYRLNN